MVLLEGGEVVAAGAIIEDGDVNTAPRRRFSPLLHDNGEIRSDVSNVAATWAATITVHERRIIRSVGTGTFGELGLGADVNTSNRFTTIEGFPPHDTEIIDMAASMGHVAVVLSNGEVWGWGAGRKGQLGEPAQNIFSPRKIEGLSFAATRVICGKDFSCVFGQPHTGELCVLGPKRNDKFEIQAKAPLQCPHWTQIAASWGSVFVLGDDGKVKAWGRDDHGQLPPDSLPPVKSLAAGSEHCVVLTRDNRVLTWGWGEHGNCGHPTDAHGNVRGHGNSIELSQSAIAVFAGCATTFVLAEGEACR